MNIDINYNFDKNKKYVLACSFGPDSMALFDILFKSKCNFIVAFVNYHKRKVSDDEQKRLINYCHQLNIPYEILSVKKKVTNNFQNYAREIRYNFFKKICKKYNADGLFVGHQQDDLIETYIMQKKRNNRVEYYGIKNISFLKEMKVIRPLLKYTKNELLNYCYENKIPFSIDETNFKFDYLRNKIRNGLVNLTKEHRKEILCEINKKNHEIYFFRTNLNKKIKINSSKLEIKKLISFKKNEINEIIIQFISFNLNQFKIKKHINISINRINEIYKICLSRKKNVMIPITDKICLFKEYNEIVFRKLEKNNYFYIIRKPGKLITNEFIINFSKNNDKSYPIIVRPISHNDKIMIGSCFHKVNRFFINWKVPIYFRERWPVFCNLKNEILYVPKYNVNFIDSKSRLIVKF